MKKINRNRAILVTGAAKRIGAGLAKELATDGWFVHIHYHSSESEAKSIVAEIKESGGSARTVAANLADISDVENLIADCVSAGPPLTSLINNASLFENDDLKTLSEELWSRHMKINLQAPTFLARDLAKHLPDGEIGCVINVLDNKVFALNPDYFSYTATKFALLGITQTLAMAMAPSIRVCGIAPGITLISREQTKAEFRRAHDNNPLNTGCTVADIVNAARLILSTPSMTGRTITIDGGQSLTRAPRDIAFL